MTAPMRDIDVRVSGPGWPFDDAQGEVLVRQVLRAVEEHRGPLHGGTLEVWFAGNDDLRGLNHQYRGKDVSTNVLSFTSAAMPVTTIPSGFGQLALADGVCADEAKARALDLLDHTRHLVLHGLLHVQGYDHETPQQADEMEAVERAIMKMLGLHDPYVMSGEAHA